MRREEMSSHEGKFEREQNGRRGHKNDESVRSDDDDDDDDDDEE